MIKVVRLTEKNARITNPVIIEFEKHKEHTGVYMYETGDLTKKRVIQGSLIKETKRGYTYRAVWLTTKAVDIFLPREDFIIEEI